MALAALSVNGYPLNSHRGILPIGFVHQEILLQFLSNSQSDCFLTLIFYLVIKKLSLFAKEIAPFRSTDL